MWKGCTNRENLPRVLFPEEKATVRCSQRHPGSDSSAGSLAPLRRTTTYVHGSDSLTRFHPPLCQKWHVELILSGFVNYAATHLSLDSTSSVSNDWAILRMFDGSSSAASCRRRGLEGPTLSAMRQVSAKLHFTLGVSYRMIVPLVVSSPICFPNGKAGIMDIGPLHLKPISNRKWAAYAVAVVGVLATFEEPEAVAC